MSIELSRELISIIKRHGEVCFPNECCGFLLGAAENGKKRVRDTRPIENAREQDQQYHRFLITPDTFRLTEQEARDGGLEIIGFYHSHPNAEAQPSDYDLDHAWPWYSYLICSIREEKAQEMTSWVMADDRSAFQGEEIVQSD